MDATYAVIYLLIAFFFAVGMLGNVVSTQRNQLRIAAKTIAALRAQNCRLPPVDERNVGA